MMQTPTANSYQLNMKLGKSLPVSTAVTTSTMMSNSSRKTSCSDAASDIIDADYVDRNIPKMELLKISYVSRSRNNLTNTTTSTATSNDDCDVVQLRAKKRIHSKQQLYQRSHSDGLLKVSELAKLSGCTENAAAEHNSSGSNKTVSSNSKTTAKATATTTPPKSQPLPMSSHHQNPLKYTVYKKHNSCDATAAMKSEKLQYTNDDAIFKAKKKYSMFDGRKRNSIDNIQFYFDSKSYERHVDNKIYGVLMPNANTTEKTQPPSSNERGARASVKRLVPAAPPPNYENKSNSWNFVKATKQLLNGSHVSRMASGQKYMKNVPSAKKQQRDSSLVDLTRIGQLFRETRRASADDLLDGGRIPVRSETKPRTTSESNDSGHGGGVSSNSNGNGTNNDNKTASTSKKIKKLSTNFENKCLCDYKPKQFRAVSERKTSAPPHLFSDANSGRTNENVRIRRKLEYPPEIKPDKKSPPLLESKKSNRMQKCNSFELDDEKASHFDQGFYLLDKVRSKSVSIEHGIPLFGHFQSKCTASPSTCGYKNCTFINCPMSSITAALSKSSNHNAEKDKNLEKCKSKHGNNISITKIDTISNKSKLYLKTKDFNDDDDELLKEFDRNGDGVTLNNLKNAKNTTIINNSNNSNGNSNTACTNGGTTIPIKFTPNQQNLNNSMKCKSVEKLDFNSTSTIENKKFNNFLSAANEKTSFSKNEDDNRVKIFIRNPPVHNSANASNSPIYETSSSADSVSDYYDSVPNESDSCDKKPSENDNGKCNLGDFGITPTTNLLKPSALMKQSTINSTPASGKSIKNLFPSRLGCDGAIFWNDCFYYDEHACCSCKMDADKVSNSNETRSSDCCTCSQNRSSTNSSGHADDDDDLEVNHNRNQFFFFISQFHSVNFQCKRYLARQNNCQYANSL